MERIKDLFVIIHLQWTRIVFTKNIIALGQPLTFEIGQPLPFEMRNRILLKQFHFHKPFGPAKNRQDF